MTLAQLVQGALGRDLPLGVPGETAVAGVAQDHRQVAPGFVFVARQGDSLDGHRFARLAVEAGAVAVVGRRSGVSLLPWRGAAGLTVPYVRVPDDREAVARLAAWFFGEPSKALEVVGVTGTDGKTTTAFLIHHLLGASAGLISTAGVRLGDAPVVLEGHFTTPEAPEVQRLLATARDAGLTRVVLESSSHGFAQRRLDEVRYAVGVWTNLSPEHLDFHKTLEAYREAKATLMRRARVSVLNRDDPHYPAFRAAARAAVSYGEHPESDYRAQDIREDAGGLAFTLVSPDGAAHPAALPMVGRYNVHNALASLAAAHTLGLSIPDALARLKTFPGVPGRMQTVQAEPFRVVVDFAHTPPALEKALGALAGGTTGRRIVVVGAAGERDPGKRAPLGEVAARCADLAVFTEEDSRSEDTGVILAEMRRGALGAGGREGETFWCEPDRRAAIRLALRLARPGDAVLLAGKGHERTLERALETLPWDEAAEARRALAEQNREAGSQESESRSQ